MLTSARWTARWLFNRADKSTKVGSVAPLRRVVDLAFLWWLFLKVRSFRI